MEHSFTCFTASMVMVIASRLIDVIQWKNKNDAIWLAVSRLILVIALIVSIKAVYELLVSGQLCGNFRRFG